MIQTKNQKFLTVFFAAFAASLCFSMRAEAIDISSATETERTLTLETCGNSCPGHEFSGSTGGTAAPNTIKVVSGVHTVTFDGLEIDATQYTDSSGGQLCAFSIEGGTVNLTLTNDNTLKSGQGNAGIYVGVNATLNVMGDGSLNATGGNNGAGIGGQGWSPGGTIHIQNGTVTATGGSNAAGIGGSINSGAKNVTVSGGTVNAKGGNSTSSSSGSAGAGIGYGRDGIGGEVVILGGEVTATGGFAQNGTQVSGVASDTLSSIQTDSQGNVTTHPALIHTNGVTAGLSDFHGIIGISQAGGAEEYTVYGSAIKSDSFNLKQGDTLLFANGSCSLTVPSRWVLNGTVTGPGTIYNVENITLGAGDIDNNVTLKVPMTRDDINITQVTYNGTDQTSKAITITENKVVQSLSRTCQVDTDYERKIILGAREVDGIVDAGTYTVTYSKSGYSPITVTVTVDRLQLAMTTPFRVTAIPDQSYNAGQEVKPEPDIRFGTTPLIKDTDYMVSYLNNTAVGDATATVTGMGNYIGTLSLPFKIVSAPIDQVATVAVDFDPSETLVYNGQPKNPTVTVTLEDGTALSEGTDYTIEYEPNDLTSAGTVAVKVNGQNNYSGTAIQEFTIEPIPLTITGATAKDRQYDGTTKVAITEVTYDDSGILSADEGMVTLEIDGLMGDISSPNVGTYSTVTFEDYRLSGEKGGNYALRATGSINLTQDVTITQADGPAAPTLSGTYELSATTANTFAYTVSVKDPIEDAVYEYRVDEGAWQNSNVFDGLVPGSTHTFEARTKANANVKAGEIGSTGSVTLHKLEQAAPDLTFAMTIAPNADGSSFTLTIPFMDNVEYSFDGKNYSQVNTKTDCQANTEYTGYVRYPETVTLAASAPVTDTQTTPKLTVATPVISPEGGSYVGSQTIEITCATEGATIHYTTDGKDPTTSSTIYSEPFTLSDSATIKAIAVMGSMENSSIASAKYSITQPELMAQLIVKEGITEVPANLLNTPYNSVESITTQLTRLLTIQQGYTYLNMAFYDVTLQISTDGVNWEDATVDNYPKEGLTVTLPYPGDTGKDTHDFVVSHMFTETSSRLGITAGATEEPTVTKTDAGLKFTLKGLSPLAVAWRSAAQATGEENTGDGTTGDGTTGDGTTDTTATGTGTTGTGTTSGQTAAAGSGTTGTGATATQAASLPKTGDHNMILLWIVLACASVAVLVFLKKRRN